MTTDTSSLYAAWKKIYPRHQEGFFRNLRWVLYALELGIFFLLPFLRWQRSAGLPTQAVLFDLPGRKFYIFDLVIWPQDIFLLAFLLIAAAIGLFFMTALAGRVLCGYMCLQTVWTDLFLLLEKLFEGNRKQRIKLDSSPWGIKKAVIKAGKHLSWLLVSLLTGFAVVAYFIDVFTLPQQVMAGSLPFAAGMTVCLAAVSTYAMAGFAREQVCIYMCPYARFQGAMFDEDTLIVAYNPQLGEPRESNRRTRAAMGAKAGMCIDCNACVTTCPTGIDIRDGQQYECIMCGACIDACDSVRQRLGGGGERLLSYTSLQEIKGNKTHWFRGRVVAYAALMALVLGGFVLYLARHATVELTVIGHRQPLYIMQSDGSIQNNYTIRILNMTSSEQTYALGVEGLAGAALTVAAVASEDTQGHPLLTAASGSVTPFTVYLRQARDHVTPGKQELRFTLTAQSPQGGSTSYKSVFIRP
ncbi:MAG: cytochrome c oxidase accessory protein CcoG [Magnetococcales bacterium]|nr:cytochrome c oxidase accessory protein CcoG [Magnetococcales bacterium]